jgi:hypothetical protein
MGLENYSSPAIITNWHFLLGKIAWNVVLAEINSIKNNLALFVKGSEH